MFPSSTAKKYIFDKKGKIKEIDSLSCKIAVSPQKYVNTQDSFTCTTHVLPQNLEASQGNYKKMMNNIYEQNFDTIAMENNVYVNELVNLNNTSALPYVVEEYNKIREIQMAETPKPLNFTQGSQYYTNSPQGMDPGVVAVSNALFSSNTAFHTIPIKSSPNVFRRRRKGELNSEWSNAFITRIDPCECANPEEEYKPYEMTKVYDEAGVKTIFNFNN